MNISQISKPMRAYSLEKIILKNTILNVDYKRMFNGSCENAVLRTVTVSNNKIQQVKFKLIKLLKSLIRKGAVAKATALLFCKKLY